MGVRACHTEACRECESSLGYTPRPCLGQQNDFISRFGFFPFQNSFIRARVGDMGKSLESGWRDWVVNGEERHE